MVAVHRDGECSALFNATDIVLFARGSAAAMKSMSGGGIPSLLCQTNWFSAADRRFSVQRLGSGGGGLAPSDGCKTAGRACRPQTALIETDSARPRAPNGPARGGLEKKWPIVSYFVRKYRLGSLTELCQLR